MTAAGKHAAPVPAAVHRIETEEVPCYLCGSMGRRAIGSGTDREYFTAAQEFFAVECVDCGLRYLNPRPTIAELPTIYPPTYYSYNMDQRPENLSLAAKLRHKVHGLRFRKIFALMDRRPRIDVLDVGCGDGWMLYLFKAADPDRVQTYGVDINPEVCEVARRNGHTVYCGLFEQVTLDREFDIVNLSNVIEHVADPVGVVRKSYALLRPGGLLVLETPNTQSWEGKWLVDGDWGSYHFPRHWTFFDVRTIRMLAEPHGFRFVEAQFHPAPTQWVWTCHNLAMHVPGFAGRLLQRLFEPKAVFEGGLKPLILLSGFAIFDSVSKLATGCTSNMTAVFQRP